MMGNDDDGEPSRLEFRSYTDDAWYSVRAVTEGVSGDVLRIKYCGFADENDSVFRANDFSDLKHMMDFASRFRPVSVQLQDSECSKVDDGLLVCASHYFMADDLRFYDALVEGVDRCEHSFENGEEECLCTFILSWLHGPNAGNVTAENIGHICRVQFSEEIDPVVASFLKTAREKLSIASCDSSSEVTTGITHNDHGEVPTLKIGQKLSFSHHLKQEKKCTKWFLSDTLPSKSGAVGYPCEKTGQEMDFGGGGNYYLILIENLEKGLTPLAIMEFLRTKVPVTCQALIFPCLSSDFFMRGSILLDSKRKFEMVCNFLENPDQIIASSSGRPWVITEKMMVHSSLRASIEILSLVSQKGDVGSSNELKVVRSGTDEYKVAKELSNMYQEFSNHLKRLQKRLIVEEGNVWQQYNAKRRIKS
ncbi:SAWADEE domain containing protein [Parasponia andersonii]|uniref:SAWADEE domain containing protein n=1 Tax=Parasponia andersonii TaxID=3476 RepID=A0A2P5B632_PARAD|nr:SAWADEE domain containing protein [Parasponia andersonii]